MRHLLRGTGLKAPLLHPRDLFWDLRLGISTFGFVPAIGDHASDAFRAHYEPTPYRTLFRVFDRVGLGPEDVFVDLGSGLGRAVFAALHRGARRSVGVELDETLHLRALANRARSGADPRRVEFVRSSASTYGFDDATIVFLFHPFGAGTLARAIDGLDASLDRAPRAVQIAYLNPVHESVLGRSRYLVRRRASTRTGAVDERYEIGFWSTER